MADLKHASNHVVLARGEDDLAQLPWALVFGGLNGQTAMRLIGFVHQHAWFLLRKRRAYFTQAVAALEVSA